MFLNRMQGGCLAILALMAGATHALAQDCNNDGIPDALQLIGNYQTNIYDYGNILPCDLGGSPPIGTRFFLPPALGDVTLEVFVGSHNINDAGESIDLYANGLFVATLFAGTNGCEAVETASIPPDDWNSILLTNPDNAVVFEGVRNAQSCAGPDDSPVCDIFSAGITIEVNYTFDADANNNGWLDECIPDCNPVGPDSDGDGVVDNCDQCPNTIAAPSIVDGFGCLVHPSVADIDRDGDADIDDYSDLASNLLGPDTEIDAGEALDLDQDADIDMHDIAVLLRGARGRGIPADPSFQLDRLPMYRLIRSETRVKWSYGNEYCENIFGTHMGAVDKTSNIPEQQQIDEMTAAAVVDPDRSTWIGLRYDATEYLWRWSNGLLLIPPDQGGTDADNWDGTTPDPLTDGTSAFFALMSHTTLPPLSFRWENATDNGSVIDNARNFLAQLPPTSIAPMPQATTQTVAVSLESPSAGQTVNAGATVNWTISFDTSSGDNAGLAGLVVDLVQNAGNPELFDIPQADNVPAAMSNFATPNGINNPAENGASSGYVGVQRGVPGAMDLVQIGGTQNNLGEALPGGTFGQATNVVSGVGQSGTVILATGSFTAPITPGAYEFQLTNAKANVFDSIQVAPSASEVLAPTIDVSAGTLSFTVVFVDSDGDGVPDSLDQCLGFDDSADDDGDGVADGCDNCPQDVNASQADSDGADPALNPVAVWHFEEGAGDSATDVIGGHAATDATGLWTTNGHRGGALDFPGGVSLSSGISTDFDLTDALTISLWVNPSSFPNNFHRFVSSTGSHYMFRLNGQRPHFRLVQGGSAFVARASNELDTNQWYHLVATWDGQGDGMMRIYIDGVEVDYAVQSTVTGMIDSSNNLTINATGESFVGRMDELAIFGRGLSTSEVVTLFAEGLGDGIGDACDTCSNVWSQDQTDTDTDGFGDACDQCPGFDDNIDSDADGTPDGCDACAGGAATGDVDADGNVDIDDFESMSTCLAGPGGGSAAGCECFDFDANGEITLRDFAQFQVIFSQD